MNFDEMQLSLDQNSERPGGRPADTPTNPSIADPGDGQFKSGSYCTVVASIVGNEPGIPLFIFPTQAKSGEVNVYPKRLESFPQVKAKYGNTFARWYDVNIQFSPKGSMNSSIMRHWVKGFSEYYPDVADVPGKRVIVKSDFGPGRLKNEEFMNNLFVDGFKFFASLPNGTEITQEMDQLFAEFKRLCYLNRDQLFDELVFVFGPKAKLTLDHVGYIVFGGELEIAPSRIIRLKHKPFTEAFTEEKIKSAREGCGYWPNTRNALKSKKVRHVLQAYEQSINRGGNNDNDTSNDHSDSPSIDDIDYDNASRNSDASEENPRQGSNSGEGFITNLFLSGSDNDNQDIQEELLQSIEDLNIKTVAILVGKGYSNVAELGTRKLLRESATHSGSNNNNHVNEEDAIQSRIILRTEPNTQQRQDQLAGAKNAGEFHRITMGGSILNCPDMMIGLARKRMVKDAEALEKQKKTIQVYGMIEDQARSVFAKPYSKWTAKDFKVAIKYKQGLKAPVDRKWNQNAKLAILRAFYEEFYKGRARLVGPDEICWKPEDETKLERMKAGEISSVQETTMYARSLEGRKDYLVSRLLNLSSESRFNILEDIAVLLTHEERNKLGTKLGFVISDDSDNESEHYGTDDNTTPIVPLLLTEILDEQSPNQTINYEEDTVNHEEESFNISTTNTSNVNIILEDDSLSEKSSECSFESLLLTKGNNTNSSRDDDSDSSSCFNFGQEQRCAQSETTNEDKEDDTHSRSPDINHDLVLHTGENDIENSVASNEQKEDGAIDDEGFPVDDESSKNRKDNSTVEVSSACTAPCWIRMSQITTEKNGVALIQDELNERGISFDKTWKIRKLKNVLSSEGLDGDKLFQPKSSLILKAIEDETI